MDLSRYIIVSINFRYESLGCRGSVTPQEGKPQGAGVLWTPLPQAEAPTEATDENRVALVGVGQSPNIILELLL